MARFKDLCLDVADADRAAAFWAPALGLVAQRLGPTVVRLGDDDPTHTLWLNVVPEPKRGKLRAHLDVEVAAVDDLLALGAQVLAEQSHWTVLADPEGNEVCAFVREPARLRPYRGYEVVVDSIDALAIGRWWADVLGARLEQGADGDFCWVEPAGQPLALVFTPVPEPKTAKNRLHWDVDGRTDALLARGATLLRSRGDDLAWDVLADPEGNEFCVFAPDDAG